jgi:hypothetical protein
MAHYALIDENHIVVQVIAGIDENVVQQDLDGTHVGGSSEAWEEFYSSRPWFQGLICKRTSYNTSGGVHSLGGTPFRKNYAGIGYTYDEARDAFIPPQTYPSWILEEETCQWIPPISFPEDGKKYVWNENNQSWEEVELN